jgi:2-dehydro-3-deoxyglucarate aldolase/4-hydroxy-2-oxoheptanedioate aldolase
MKQNPVKRKLAAGEIAVGTMMMEFATPGIPHIAAGGGAEFAIYDMEHTGWTLETIRMLMACSRSADMVPIVRPPTASYEHMAHVMDVGAMGLAVPLVNTVEQAKLIVESAKFPPAGRRGVAFSIAHDEYKGGDVLEKMRSANDESLLIAQIETAEGLNNVEKIAAVDGIDVLWIGQFDLTTSLGIPGQVKHQKFIDASRRILEACQSAGKAAGCGSLFLDEVCQARDQGFRFLVYTADLWIYQKELRNGIRTIRGEA